MKKSGPNNKHKSVPPTNVAWPQPFAMSTALLKTILTKVNNKSSAMLVFPEKDENGNANLIFNWGKNYNYNRFTYKKLRCSVSVDFNGEKRHQYKL